MYEKIKPYIIHILFGISCLALILSNSHYKTKVERIREETHEEYTKLNEKAIHTKNEEILKLKQDISINEKKHLEYVEQTDKKLMSLVTENSSLKKSSTKVKLKIVKPDGTILEKEVDKNNYSSSKNVVAQVKEEYSKKLSIIEDKWKSIHEKRVLDIKNEYEHKLKELSKENKELSSKKDNKTEIKEGSSKHIRPEIGLSTRREVYFHGSYNAFDPICIGGGISGTKTNIGDLRLGIGLQF